MSNWPDIMTVKQMSEYTGFGLTKCYEALRCQLIPCVKLGASYRVAKKVIDRYFEEGRDLSENN